MAKNFWKFRNEAESETAELLLYGEISDVSWYGDEVTPREFHDGLVSCEGKDLAVHINSPGGDVFAAQAIYTQLKAYPGKVTMHIDGMCASAATIVACAGDTVVMPSNTIYMIHNPKSAMAGYFDAPELEKISRSLDAVKQTIVNVYTARVKGRLSETQLKHRMDSETWMTADEARELGFVDEVAEAIPIENRWEGDSIIVNSVACKLDRFKNLPELRAVFPARGEERSDAQMASNDALQDALQKFKDALGIGDRQAAAPQEDAARAAVMAERQRVADLDAMKNGSPAVDAIVETAKKNGATAESVRPYVDAIPQEEPKAADGEKAMAAILAMLQDSKDSGADGVLPSPKGNERPEDASRKEFLAEIERMSRAKGGN